MCTERMRFHAVRYDGGNKVPVYEEDLRREKRNLQDIFLMVIVMRLSKKRLLDDFLEERKKLNS